MTVLEKGLDEGKGKRFILYYRKQKGVFVLQIVYNELQPTESVIMNFNEAYELTQEMKLNLTENDFIELLEAGVELEHRFVNCGKVYVVIFETTNRNTYGLRTKGKIITARGESKTYSPTTLLKLIERISGGELCSFSVTTLAKAKTDQNRDETVQTNDDSFNGSWEAEKDELPWCVLDQSI